MFQYKILLPTVLKVGSSDASTTENSNHYQIKPKLQSSNDQDIKKALLSDIGPVGILMTHIRSEESHILNGIPINLKHQHNTRS